MSLWEFQCCVSGFVRAHTVKEKIKPPTPEEFYERVNRMKYIN